MKYSLIMENWRRYQKLEENLYLLETKKITYESLVMKLENQEITPVVYLESLDHYVTEQSRVYLASISEGIFKETVSALMRKAAAFAISSISKVLGVLNKIDVGVGVAAMKTIGTALGILKKLVPVAKKVMKVMGPFVGIVIIVGLALCSQAAMAAGLDPETLKMTIPDDVLRIATEIAADLAKEMEASTKVSVDINQIVDVSQGGEQVVQNATEIVQELGDDTAVDKAIRAAELLQTMAEWEGEMTVEQYETILDKLDVELADTINEAVKDAQALKENEPGIAEEMEKIADLKGRLRVQWDGIVDSEISSKRISSGDTQADVLRSQSVQVGKKSIVNR